MTDLNKIVEQIDLLAPIPAIATQIMTKYEDPDNSLSEKDLQEIIAQASLNRQKVEYLLKLF